MGTLNSSTQPLIVIIMHTKTLVVLFTVLCAALCRAQQEVRVVYEFDWEENNGTQYTPAYDGNLTPEQQEYFNLAWGIAFIVFGLIFVVFGYRIFRITLFVIGAIAGAATAYLLLQTHAQLALFLVLIIAAVSGIILGLMFVCIFYLGLFALGHARLRAGRHRARHTTWHLARHAG